MRSIPYFYAIIGDGRMARHMTYYFDAIGISYRQWCRAIHQETELSALLAESTHVLVLLSDQAIDAFITRHIINQHSHLQVVHFSGSLISSHAYAAHPLCTFSLGDAYSSEEYQRIPFVIAEQAPHFSQLLPGFPNPHYRISDEKRALYHALCVLGSNFTAVLWEKFFSEMHKQFNIETHHLMPILQRTFENIKISPHAALTGPLQRKDIDTLQRDLQALQEDPFHLIFKTFINVFVGEEIDAIRS